MDRGRTLGLLLASVISVCVEAVHTTATTCHTTVSCGFQGNSCGFTSTSAEWKLQLSAATEQSGQGYQVFQSDKNSMGDLISPWLCNKGAVHVELSSLIVVSQKNEPVELRVLASCDNIDLKDQPLLAIEGPVLSWKRYNFTLPACPQGQQRRMVFRAISTSPESFVLLDDILIRPVAHPSADACVAVSCGFQETACGFVSRSADWNLHNASGTNGLSSQGYQVFRSYDDSVGDLMSPWLCNKGVVHVELSSLIEVSEKNDPVDLRVLTSCNDVDLEGQPLLDIPGPVTSWRRYNFSLPACPQGQGRRVVFRAITGSPGSSILLDDVLIRPSVTTTTSTQATLTTSTPVTGTSPPNATTTFRHKLITSTKVTTETSSSVTRATNPTVTQTTSTAGNKTSRLTRSTAVSSGATTSFRTSKITGNRPDVNKITSPATSTSNSIATTTRSQTATPSHRLVTTTSSHSAVKTIRPEVSRSNPRLAVTSLATIHTLVNTDTTTQHAVPAVTVTKPIISRSSKSNSVLSSLSSRSSSAQNSDATTPTHTSSATTQQHLHNSRYPASPTGRVTPTSESDPTSTRSEHSPHTPAVCCHHRANAEGGNGQPQSTDIKNSKEQRDLIIGVVVGVCCAVAVVAVAAIVMYRRIFRDRAQDIVSDAGGKMTDRLVQINMSEY